MVNLLVLLPRGIARRYLKLLRAMLLTPHTNSLPAAPFARR